MKIKKRLVALLAGISLLCCGLFVACDNPSGADSGSEDSSSSSSLNENTGNSEIGNEGDKLTFGDNITVYNSEKGIKIIWDKVPENTRGVSVQGDNNDGNGSYTLFEVSGTSRKYVFDEYVTAGKEYKYRIAYVNDKGGWSDTSDWFTVKANGGKGECVLKSEAVSEGIKFSVKPHSNTDSITLTKMTKDNWNANHHDLLKIDSSYTGNTLVDKYVDSGTEYEYIVREQIGKGRYWNNGIEYPADPIIQYPRYKKIKIKAAGGAGSFKVTNKDTFGMVFNESKSSITLKQKPEFNHNVSDWYVNINYNQNNNGGGNIAQFTSRDDTLEKQISSSKSNGIWNFSDCYFILNFEGFSYWYCEENLPGFPLTICINADNTFQPVVTPTSEGNKIEWKNLPPNTVALEIYDSVNQNTVFRINDLTNVKSVIDKYVTSGQLYTYSITAKNNNNDYIVRSDSVKVRAIGGIGERKVTVDASAEGIHLSATRLYDSSSINVYRSESESNYSRNDVTFTIPENNSIFITDYFVEAGVSYSYKITESLYSHNDSATIEFPRYERLVVTATGGLGKFDFKKAPEIIYNHEGRYVELKQSPEFMLEPVGWTIEGNYTNSQKNNWDLYRFGSDIETVQKINTNVDAGDYTLNLVYMTLNFGNFRTTISLRNPSEVLTYFPQTMNVLEHGKPCLIAKATDKGIQFHCLNISNDDILQTCIRVKSKETGDYADIVLKNNYLKTVLDEYVAEGKTYNCSMRYMKLDGTWEESNPVSVEATHGLGEATITNYPEAEFDGIDAIKFTKVPTVSIPSDKSWYIYFCYSLVKDFNYNLYSYSSYQKNDPSPILEGAGFGTWQFENYYLELNEYDYYYRYYQKDSQKSAVPEEIVFSDHEFKPVLTPEEDGIKIEWMNIPEEAKRLEIQTYGDNGDSRRLFVINDFTKVELVVDKNVNKGKEYTYFLVAEDETGKELQKSKNFSVESIGGSGELDFTATNTSEGIELKIPRQSTKSKFDIYKTEKLTGLNTKNLVWDSGFCFDTDDKTLIISDPFVTSGNEYYYTFVEVIGAFGNWNGVAFENADDVVVCPRYKTICVKPNSGIGDLKITNTPVAKFIATQKISFSVAPEITEHDSIERWYCEFGYNTEIIGVSVAYRYSYDPLLGNEIKCAKQGGLMEKLYQVKIHAITDSYEYYTVSKDISNLTEIPQSTYYLVISIPE